LMLPDALEVFAPAKFLKKFLRGISRVASEHGGGYLTCAKDTMVDKGTQSRDIAVEKVSAARIVWSINFLNTLKEIIVAVEKVRVIHFGARFWN
jgi:hypothetical protein